MGRYIGPGRWAYDEVIMPVTDWLALNDDQRNTKRVEALARADADAVANGVAIVDWNHIRLAAQTKAVPPTPLSITLHCEASIPNAPTPSP